MDSVEITTVWNILSTRVYGRIKGIRVEFIVIGYTGSFGKVATLRPVEGGKVLWNTHEVYDICEDRTYDSRGTA